MLYPSGQEIPASKAYFVRDDKLLIHATDTRKFRKQKSLIV